MTIKTLPQPWSFYPFYAGDKRGNLPKSGTASLGKVLWEFDYIETFFGERI
jgi:hypothetical protein